MGSLLERTVELLREDMKDRTLLELHKETGLPFYWLRKMAGRETKDPSVNRVQALYEYLSGDKLELK